MIHDVLIAGAGPAGCIAAIVLARAGARVVLVDRATFPRDKLCGDTLNPGALAVLRRLRIPAAEQGLPIEGMVVTGPRGVRVHARYPRGVIGRAIVRRAFDHALVLCAAAAGVRIEEGVLVQRPLVSESNTVVGIDIRNRTGQAYQLGARVIIAADGRESRLARSVSLARHPGRPRRWAVGAYFTDVSGMTRLGEMHVRQGHYIGVAALPGGLTNACVVTGDRLRLRHPGRLLAQALEDEPELTERFRSARMVSGPTTLGPLAVDCRMPGMAGLLLAGDAAGFIDPMTGDGLRFALRGGELAALEALRALETGATDAHVRLRAARRREFHAKWRFNRAVRQVVSSPRAIRAATHASRLCSWPMRRIISYAGDLTAA